LVAATVCGIAGFALALVVNVLSMLGRLSSATAAA
jgi:hypothetical protein